MLLFIQTDRHAGPRMPGSKVLLAAEFSLCGADGAAGALQAQAGCGISHPPRASRAGSVGRHQWGVSGTEPAVKWHCTQGLGSQPGLGVSRGGA